MTACARERGPGYAANSTRTLAPFVSLTTLCAAGVSVASRTTYQVGAFGSPLPCCRSSEPLSWPFWGSRVLWQRFTLSVGKHLQRRYSADDRLQDSKGDSRVDRPTRLGSRRPPGRGTQRPDRNRAGAPGASSRRWRQSRQAVRVAVASQARYAPASTPRPAPADHRPGAPGSRRVWHGPSRAAPLPLLPGWC